MNGRDHAHTWALMTAAERESLLSDVERSATCCPWWLCAECGRVLHSGVADDFGAS